MSLVNVHSDHNSGGQVSTLTTLASLNLQLDALAENIMAEFILSSSTTNKMTIGLLDPHGIPSISIHVSLVHFNIANSIVCEISKCQILQLWDDQNLTHLSDWDEIDLTSFKQAQ